MGKNTTQELVNYCREVLAVIEYREANGEELNMFEERVYARLKDLLEGVDAPVTCSRKPLPLNDEARKHAEAVAKDFADALRKMK